MQNVFYPTNSENKMAPENKMAAANLTLTFLRIFFEPLDPLLSFLLQNYLQNVPYPTILEDKMAPENKMAAANLT